MNFLIVKTSAIGDIIHTFPVVEYLRARFPEATIDWVVEESFRDLVSRHPFVNTVFTVATRSWRKNLHRSLTWKEIFSFRKTIQLPTYDILFDLQGNTKSALITAFASAREKVGFGYRSVPEKSNLLFTRQKYEVPDGINIQDRYLRLVQAHFADREPFKAQGIALRLTEEEEKSLDQLVNKETPRYLVAFGSNWPHKQLSEETLKGFLKRVEQEDRPFFYLIWGNEKEKEQAERLHAHFPKSVVVDRLSLPLLQGLMRKMDLVIAMDSMALHLCGKTPSFSIFGPSLASVYKPQGTEHRHFQGACPYGRIFARRCPVLRTCKTGACLKDVQAEVLFAHYQNARKCV